MQLIKYPRGWTRRHFIEQAARGIIAAGLLAPLYDVIGRHGDCAAAYPPELLSIAEYSKGKLKIGGALDASNVDIARDLLDPVTYWQIKNDGRIVELGGTETEMSRLMPASYLEATLRNNGVHRIFPDGNLYTADKKPWIGGNPFPEPKTAQEILLPCILTAFRYDSATNLAKEWNTDADGNVTHVYEFFFVDWHTVGRTTLEPKPYQSGHEDQLRIMTSVVTYPEDHQGTVQLQLWPYDQHIFPQIYGYSPDIKRVRTLPGDQPFEPMFPGETYFASDLFCLGDPLLTWGSYKLVAQGPMLACVHGGASLERSNWEHKTCGGKTGSKYAVTHMELVPEAYVCDIEPRTYQHCPYSRKRLWVDARTLNPLVMIAYDAEGKPWHQWENGFDYFERKPQFEWPEGAPDRFWSPMQFHAFDMREKRASRQQLVPRITGGFNLKFNDPGLFDKFCSLAALRRLGR